MVQRHGSNNWQYSTARAEGAGSASAVVTYRALFMKRLLPNFVYIADVEYMLVGWGPDKVATFQNGKGEEIHARMLETTSSLFAEKKKKKPSIQ